MKYASRSDLEKLINDLKSQRDKIRGVHEKLKKDLAIVDSPTNRVLTEGEKLVMRSELRSKALGSVPGNFSVERKIIGTNSDFWSDLFFDSIPISDNVAADAMQKLFLLQKYQLMGAAQFADALREASSDGRPGELGIARLVHESRSWNNLEEQRHVSVALMQAERDVVYPDRTASLELLSIASSLLEDAESSLSALRTGGEDIRLKAQPYIEQRLKREAAANE